VLDVRAVVADERDEERAARREVLQINALVAHRIGEPERRRDRPEREHFRLHGHDSFLLRARRQPPPAYYRPPRSGENANSTLPGVPPSTAYPDPTNTIPSATMGPGALIDPPRAFTPFTVSNSRCVSNDHSTRPSVVAIA